MLGGVFFDLSGLKRPQHLCTDPLRIGQGLYTGGKWRKFVMTEITV